MKFNRNKEDKIELLASEALTRQGRDAEYLMAELAVDLRHVFGAAFFYEHDFPPGTVFF